MAQVDEIRAMLEEVVREFDRRWRLELERVGQGLLRWLDGLLPRMPCDTWLDEFNRIVANLARDQVFIEEQSRQAFAAWINNANEAARRDAARAAAAQFPTPEQIVRPPDPREFPDDIPSPIDPAYPQLGRAGNSIMQQYPPAEWPKLAVATLQSYRVPEEISRGFLEWLPKEQRTLALAADAQPAQAPATQPVNPAEANGGPDVAVAALQRDAGRIPLDDVNKWLADGRAVRTSDGRYVAMRERAHGIVVDYLLERSNKPEGVEIIDTPRAAGGSRPIVEPAVDAYRVVFVQPQGNENALRGRGTDIDDLLRAGRTTAAADALEAKYLAARGSDEKVSNGTAQHLTYEQALSLYNAINGPWRTGSRFSPRPLTRTCLMRYVDKTGGTLQLSYEKLASAEPTLTQKEEFNINEMLSTGRNTIRDQADLNTGDVATAVHGATLDFTLNYTRTRGLNMRGGATVALSDTYDFDESTGKNVYAPLLSTLSSFPTDYIKDNWMWDLEQYGLAKRFDVTAQWRVTFAVTVDAAGKPAGPMTVKVRPE